MLSDAHTTRKLNVLFGVLLIFSLVTIGSIAFLSHRNEERISGSSPSESATTASLRQATLDAMRADREGNDQEAARQYRIVHLLRPLRPDAIFGLAQSLVALGQRHEAWSTYRGYFGNRPDAVVRPPGINGALAWYADLETEFGDRQEAEKTARSMLPASLKERSLRGTRLLSFAHLYSSGGVADLASARHIRRAIELNPRSISARLSYTDWFSNTFHRLEGEASLRNAERMAQVGTAVDWMTLADYYNTHKNLGKTEAAIRRAFQSTKHLDAQAWVTLAEIADRLKHGPEAQLACEAAWKMVRRDDAETLYRLAKSYRAIGLTTPLARGRAVAVAIAASRVVQPQQTDRYSTLAFVLRDAGRKDEARTLLREAIRYADAKARIWLGQDLAQLEGRPRLILGGSYGPGGGVAYRPYGSE